MESSLSNRMRNALQRTATLLMLGVVLTACSSSGGASPTSTGQKIQLRLGYFPNLTHASAIVGVDRGIFQKDLGPNVTLNTSTFTAGPEEVTAVFAGALDAAYMGPNPAINAYIKSHGQAIRIISGATSGG